VGRRAVRGEEAVPTGSRLVGAERRGGAAIAPLTSRQRAHLRALAHRLKPIAHLGADGVSDAFLTGLEEAFRTRELLKVKVLEGAPLSATAAADEIGGRLSDVHIPQVIGRTIVLYRPSPDTPQIQLP
jgi:RNA-binding protein